jgi:hypothetical protein
MRIIVLIVALLIAGMATAHASHGGPAWEHDDPARRVYGGGG